VGGFGTGIYYDGDTDTQTIVGFILTCFAIAIMVAYAIYCLRTVFLKGNWNCTVTSDLMDNLASNLKEAGYKGDSIIRVNDTIAGLGIKWIIGTD
jgi:hypothetical protein